MAGNLELTIEDRVIELYSNMVEFSTEDSDNQINFLKNLENIKELKIVLRDIARAELLLNITTIPLTFSIHNDIRDNYEIDEDILFLEDTLCPYNGITVAVEDDFSRAKKLFNERSNEFNSKIDVNTESEYIRFSLK